MNYYSIDNDGNATLEEEGFKWSYAKFDREAWKFIKRKKIFDFKKVMEVEYILKVETRKGTVSSFRVYGFPYLSKKPMASLAMWLKEVTLNRLWHMQVPKYCWKNTVGWLTKGQKIDGAISGNIYYNVSGFSGSGNINDYSDFTGIQVGLNKELSVKVPSNPTPNQRYEHLLDFWIDCPLYGRFNGNLNIGVRDLVLQWGIWSNDPKEGSFVITREGFPEINLDFNDLISIIPNWDAENSDNQQGYGYDYKDILDGDEEKFSSSNTWTRINFYYNPEPVNFSIGKNNWYEKDEVNWSIQYEVN